MNQDNTERVVLYIDSGHRTSGISENFSITLATPITKVIECEIIGSEIPYTFYALNSTNNVLCWTSSSGTTYSCTVPVGNYGITNYIALLQSNMNAQMSGFTITYLHAQYQLSFANTTAFRLDLVNASGTSTIASQLGLSAPAPLTGFGTVVNPTGVINIGGPRYLMITSARLTQPKITRPFLNSSQANVLYKMQITGSPGDILIDKNTYSNLLKYGVRQTVQTIDFQLTDDQGALVSLNGQPWSFTVNLILG